jgi:hypothetical protein
MGGCTGGDSANEIARPDRINGRPANACISFFGQAAGTHSTQFTAHPCGTDVAGRHIIGTAEGSPDFEFVSANQHLLGGWINSAFFWGSWFFSHKDSPLETLILS